MRTPRLVVLGSLGLSALLSLYSVARPQEQAIDGDAGAANQEGVQVMARGPVHEGFAEPSIRKPEATPIVPKQPPAPIEEMPPDQKPEGANVTWIPGYWAWDDDQNDFIWVSGIWRDLPPDHQWVPGYWQQADNGWQWVAGYWTVQAQQAVEYLPKPPDPIPESVPPAPEAQSIYAPGCWVWYETRYMWRPGFWLGYRPGWVWTPAYYRWTPAGYVFVDGYWDYPFADRGLLFAPVFIDRAFWGRPSWYYRPYYAVSDTFLLGALFARLNYGSYYYGDYFDRRYAGAGFIPWVDFRYGRTIPDPLFSYYRWHYARTDPRWDADMRQLYATRTADVRARPPRTFAEASRVASAPATRTGTLAGIQAASPLVPLTRVASVSNVKLQTVPKAQLNEIRQAAVQHHEFAKQRGQAEAKALAQGQTSAKTGQALKVEMPKTARPAPVTTPGANAKAPPPRPEHPKPESRPAARVESTPGTRPGTNRPPVTRPEPKVEPKGEPKTEPKREPRVEPRPAPKEEPKQAPRVEPKPAPAEPRPAPRVEPKPAPVEPKPAPVEPKPAPRVEPKPAPVEPKPAPRVEPKPAPPQPRPAPTPPPAPKEKDKKEKDK